MLIPSKQAGATAIERLKLMTTCHDGLELAEADLKHRGAGDAVGTRQSGEAGFRLIDPAQDAELIRIWHDHPAIAQADISDAVRHFWRPLAEAVD